MIRLTSTGKLVYTLLNQIVLLLLLLVGGLLLTELQALPIPSIVSDIPIQLKLITTRLFDVLILTGCITGGVMMCYETVDAQYLKWALWLWTVLIIFSIAVSSTLLIIGLLVFVGPTYIQSERSRFLTIWQVGILLCILGLILQVMFDNTTSVALFLTHVAYGVVAVSITFWLISRWSHVHHSWVNDGIISVSGGVILAGLLISASQIELFPFYGVVADIIILTCYTMLGGHHYRALRDRTNDMSLSPHWIALGTVFWLGVGFMGVMSSQVGIHDVMQGTQLADVQLDLVYWLMIFIILGLVNYIATYLRGENRRVTGYMPLWLIGFGVGLMLIIGLCTGVVEIYLNVLIQLDSEIIRVLLIPLDITSIICQLGVTLGVIIYALGYVARRPKIVVAELA